MRLIPVRVLANEMGVVAVEIELTPHPEWAREFEDSLAPLRARVVRSPLFVEMANGTLSMSRFRGALVGFYPLVESFPSFLKLTLKKVPRDNDERSNLARDWLAENIKTERQHATWYRQWARDFGVPSDTFSRTVVPPAEMDAVSNYLWRIGTQGTLSECFAAINYGIEGPSGDWTQLVAPNIQAYEGQPGVKFRKGTLLWLKAHAMYDDMHTPESLELIKLFATTKEEQDKVKIAARRSMEYYPALPR